MGFLFYRQLRHTTDAQFSRQMAFHKSWDGIGTNYNFLFSSSLGKRHRDRGNFHAQYITRFERREETPSSGT